MMKMLVGRRAFWAVLFSLTAVVGLLALTGEAGAGIRAARAKAARAKAARSRAHRHLKKRRGYADPAVVEIRSDGFHPQVVTIKRGGTVKWINKDTKTHTITFVSTTSAPNGQTAPIPPAGGTLSNVAVAFPPGSVEVGFKGTTAYFDTDNPALKGQVQVQP
jgi:plastocyanin